MTDDWDKLCFVYATKHAQEGDEVVHAVVHPPGREPFPHAWIERRGQVVDNKLGPKDSSMSVDRYYDIFHPTNIDRYKDYEATIYVIRTGHWGPWTKEERGSRPKPPKSYKRSRR